MSFELSVFTGGLVFEVTPRLDADEIEQLLAPTLAEKGFSIDSMSTIGATGLQLTCDNLLLWFNVESRSYAAPRMRVTVQPIGSPEDGAKRKKAQAGKADAADETAKVVLAITLAVLARDLGADTVYWLSKDVLIPARRFIDAALPILPRRVRTETPGERPPRLRLVPGEVTLPELGSFPVAPRRISPTASRTTRPTRNKIDRQIGLDFSIKLRELRRKEEEIADAIHSDVSLPLRMSAWIMTLLLGIFSAPLAWVLFAFNLNRGGDFRVTANVLAAAGALSLLHAAGATHVLLAMILN